MTRAPFVSGLPGAQPAAAVDPRGAELLHQVRALARDEAEALEPRCHDRKINRETLHADPLAIAQRETYEAMQFIVDLLLAEPALAQRLAAPLGARFPK